MPANQVDMKVRLIDVEGIHGLIEALTDVAAEAVNVSEQWTKFVSSADSGAMDDAVAVLRMKILDLNDYVDEHLEDE